MRATTVISRNEYYALHRVVLGRLSYRSFAPSGFTGRRSYLRDQIAKATMPRKSTIDTFLRRGWVSLPADADPSEFVTLTVTDAGRERYDRYLAYRAAAHRSAA